MKIRTSELIGAALDWAVASCERVEAGRSTGKLFLPEHRVYLEDFIPSYSWSQGGPIIEREIFKLFKNVGGTFTAQIKKRVPYYSPTYDADIGTSEVVSCSDPTPLIAAMRCYVASKMGDEIEVPDELI